MAKTGVKPILDVEEVERIFLDCLYKEGEYESGTVPKGCVAAYGITCDVGFHPERLESHRAEIEEMLMELPDEFKESSGSGGWAFAKACFDRHGRQWTGFQKRMEQLFQLGLAIGKVVDLTPGDARILTPDGLPYYLIKDK